MITSPQKYEINTSYGLKVQPYFQSYTNIVKYIRESDCSLVLLDKDGYAVAEWLAWCLDSRVKDLHEFWQVSDKRHWDDAIIAYSKYFYLVGGKSMLAPKKHAQS